MERTGLSGLGDRLRGRIVIGGRGGTRGLSGLGRKIDVRRHRPLIVRRHKCSPLLTDIVCEDCLAGEGSKTARFAKHGSGEKRFKVDCCDGRNFLLRPGHDIEHLSWE